MSGISVFMCVSGISVLGVNVSVAFLCLGVNVSVAFLCLCVSVCDWHSCV